MSAATISASRVVQSSVTPMFSETAGYAELVKNLTIASLITAKAERGALMTGSLPTGWSIAAINDRIFLHGLFPSFDVLSAIGKYLGRAPEDLVFDDFVYSFRHKMKQLIPSRTMDDNNGTKNFFTEALLHISEAESSFHDYLKQFNIDPAQVTTEEFVARLVSQFAKNSTLKSNNYKLFIFAEDNARRSLTDIRNHINDFEYRLKERVIGQPRAIRAVVNGELAAAIRPSAKLRSIYTFAGPSGVGKTELAKTHANILTSLGNGYVFRTFNMELYSDERAAGNLFGSGSQYTDSALGELTLHAEAYPRSVILFDEIEKAHPRVIQALLTLLDTGHARDATSGEEAAFSQCVVIFTTNLGQKEFSEAGIYGDVDVFDVLANATLPGASTPALSPELINRLQQGTAVRFNPLNSAHLLSIAQKHLESIAESNSSRFSYEFSTQFAAAVIFAQLPKPVARSIPTAIDRYLSESKQALLRSEYIDLVGDGHLPFSFEFDQSFYREPSRYGDVIYVGQNQPSAAIKTALASFSIERVGFSDLAEQLRSPIRYEGIIINDKGANEPLIRSLLVDINALSPTTPVFLISSADDYSADMSADIYDGVWEVFKHKDLPAKTDTLRMILEVNWRVLQSKRRHLRFKHDVEINADDTAITAKITRVCFVPQTSSSRVKTGVPGLLEERPTARMSDVIGLRRAKSQLKLVMSTIEHAERLERMRLPMRSGILFTGPPGTGKTLLARAVAGESNLPFIALNVGELASSAANGTATNIQKAFDAARDIAPCIMFIDEIDAIGSSRMSGGDPATRSANTAVNTLLTNLDGLQKSAAPVLVIAATNNAEVLDPALRRAGRLDQPVICDLPDRQARADFFLYYAKKYGITITESEAQQYSTLTLGLSGAQLEKVFTDLIYVQMFEHNAEEISISATDLRASITRVNYGSSEGVTKLSDEAKQLVAWHEAGHLLAHKLLLPEDPVSFATIEPRNHALGFVVTQRREGQGPQTLSEIKATLIVFLAGREAERILKGDLEVTAGADNDIHQATLLAHRAVCHLGLDSEVGIVRVTPDTANLLSDAAKNKISKRIAAWLDEARQGASELLTTNRELLEEIAEKLYQQESLYVDEIDSWFADKPAR